MLGSKEKPPENRPAAAMVWGRVWGFIAYASSLVATIACVPRRSEGLREIVDIPWSVFAFLPTTLAFIVGVVASYWPAAQRSRMIFLLSCSVAVAVCALFTINLLRRDYMGKF